MRRSSIAVVLPMLTAAILLCEAPAARACCLFNWWGASYAPTYSSYYSASFAPTYSASYVPATSYYASYVPTYTASYVPTYTTSYLPTTTYYAASATSSACCTPCCEGGSCGTTCCSPCTSCVSCCANCCPDGCALNSSGSSNSSGSAGTNSSPTPVNQRNDSGTQGRNPTFIEEEEKGYNNNPGFSPKTEPDPLDQNPGVSDAVHKTLRFEAPEAPAETSPAPSLENKITSRPTSQRTRLIARRSWEQPVLAKNVSRQVPVENAGWVPVPLPTQLVQK